jgi:cytochrome c oxidase subunit 4
MHVRYGPKVLWIFVGAGFFWLGIMFVLALGDYMTRVYLPTPTIWRP